MTQIDMYKENEMNTSCRGNLEYQKAAMDIRQTVCMRWHDPECRQKSTNPALLMNLCGFHAFFYFLLKTPAGL